MHVSDVYALLEEMGCESMQKLRCRHRLAATCNNKNREINNNKKMGRGAELNRIIGVHSKGTGGHGDNPVRFAMWHSVCKETTLLADLLLVPKCPQYAQQRHPTTIPQPKWKQQQQQQQQRPHVVPVISAAAFFTSSHALPMGFVEDNTWFSSCSPSCLRIKLTDAVFLVLRGYPHVWRSSGVAGHPRERRLKRGSQMLGKAFYGRDSPRYVLLAVIV